MLILLQVVLVFLAAGDLALLGRQLRPLDSIFGMPNGGAIAIDPAVCLAAYAVLAIWLPRNLEPQVKKSYHTASILGILAAICIVVNLEFSAVAARQDAPVPFFQTQGMIGVALLLFGIAGWQSQRITGNLASGLSAGLWSAMIAGIGGGTFIVRQIVRDVPAPETHDAWRDYQALAFGNEAAQSLFFNLNRLNAYLLFLPLAGAAVAFAVAYFSQAPATPKKKK